MKNKISYTFSFKVLAVTVIYLFIAVSHIFYLSNNTSIKTNHSVSLFKRKVESLPGTNTIQRTDKATITESSKQALAKAAVLNLLSPFTGRYLISNIKQVIPANVLFDAGNRYAYISLCTFRI